MAAVLLAAAGCGGSGAKPPHADCAPGGLCGTPLEKGLEAVTDAAGLGPLRTTPMPIGWRELRIWIGDQMPRAGTLIRLGDHGASGGADGAMFDWRPDDSGGPGAPPCPAGAAHAHGFALCPRRSMPAARWDLLLALLERHRVWTLPGSAEAAGGQLPSLAPGASAGAAVVQVVIETRADSVYRTYGYTLPQATRDSAVADVEAILVALREFTASSTARRPGPRRRAPDDMRPRPRGA